MIILCTCTQLTIPVQTIFNITKEKTALLIPNAIQIHATNQEKYGFSSLMNRDVTYAVIKMVWDNSRSSSQVCWPDSDQLTLIREAILSVAVVGAAGLVEPCGNPCLLTRGAQLP